MKGRGSRLPESAVAPGSGAKDRFVLVDFVGATSWESEVFEPSAASAGSAADDAAMVSGHDGAVDSLPTVEADVGIAEVQVTDPFASSDPVIRGLHSKLDAARQALERDRETHRRDEARLAALRHELDEEHRRLHAARREAFAQLVTGLHRFAPLVPISGDVLAPLTPWATDLAALNQLFGVERPSVQAHIDAVLAATPTASPVDRPTAV
jgi:type I site-specific restriction endonuclease